MDEALGQAVLEDILRHEDCITWLYCDPKGYPTIGVGDRVCDLRDFVLLPLEHVGTGVLATDEEKIAAWSVVEQAYRKGRSAVTYRGLTDLRISREFALDRAKQRLESEFLPPILRVFHRFHSWPVGPKRAVLDIAYNCGAHWMNGFPSLVSACQSEDWAKAAKECFRADARRPPTGADPEGLGPRNIWTRGMFLSALS
jgi:hypothetical protein